MHIYWFAPFNPTCPSTRYRGIFPLEYLLSKEQISFDLYHPQRTLLNRLYFLKLFSSIVLMRKKNSLIVIQKICFQNNYSKALALLVKLSPKNTLFDIDDAEYIKYGTEKINFFLRRCTTVQVGSKALLDYCLPYNPNTYLNTSSVHNHEHRKKQRNSEFTLGWIGDTGNGNKKSVPFSHKTSLFTILFPALTKLKVNCKLVLIGVKKAEDKPVIEEYFEAYPHIKVQIKQSGDWTKDDWLYEEIAKFDVGLAPLVDHEFTHAKCAFKTKQYLSCGVPVVASDIGENRNFVLNGKNGILCKSQEEFTAGIRQFMAMSNSEYHNYSQSAVESISNFSIEKYANTLMERNIVK